MATKIPYTQLSWLKCNGHTINSDCAKHIFNLYNYQCYCFAILVHNTRERSQNNLSLTRGRGRVNFPKLNILLHRMKEKETCRLWLHSLHTWWTCDGWRMLCIVLKRVVFPILPCPRKTSFIFFHGSLLLIISSKNISNCLYLTSWPCGTLFRCKLVAPSRLHFALSPTNHPRSGLMYEMLLAEQRLVLKLKHSLILLSKTKIKY